MKKIALCSLLLALGLVGNSFAKCKLAPDCSGGGDKGNGWSQLSTKGNRSNDLIDGEQCYRCNWGDNEYECSPGSVVAILHADYSMTGEVKDFYTCSDSGNADDDWIKTNPNSSCSPNDVELAEFARKMNRDYVLYAGASHKTNHFLIGGGRKTGSVQDSSGDSLILGSGSDGCVAYLCEPGYKADADRRNCVPEVAQQQQQQQPQNCTQGTRHPDPAMLTLISACNGQNCSLDVNQCYPDAMLDCLAAAVRGEPANWTGSSCNCGSVSGKSYTWDTNEKKCVTKGGNNAGKTCEQLYPNGSAERLACCRAGKETIWTGTATSGTCKCADETKNWTYTAGARTGQCVVKEQKQQNEEPCYYNYTGYIRCPNGNFSLEMKQYKLEKSDLEGKSCDEFKRLYENDVNASETLRAKICAEKQSAVVVTVPVGPSETQIKDARDTLKTFAANAESNASGWKTAEGKFNTTRLASDLTAGVVLGTVGGVVSGVVIKKKQVEKGFDALHCTVGGQKIADWGDTFTVGLQR